MVDTETKEIAERLRGIRRSSGVSTMRMAEVLDVSEAHYKKIERGTYKLDVKKIRRLNRFMGVDPMFLLMGVKREDIGYSRIGFGSDPDIFVRELMNYCQSEIDKSRAANIDKSEGDITDKDDHTESDLYPAGVV